MNKKVEIIAEVLGISVDQVEREWDVRNVSLPFIDEMLEEYGKYCAYTVFDFIFDKIGGITKAQKDQWWKEFKAKQDDKTGN